MDDWKQAVRHMRNDLNMEWRDIGIACMHYFPNETYSQVYEHVRHIDKSHHKKVVGTLMSSPKGIITLVYSDAHTPFDHPGYLPFLQDVKKQYGCTRGVHLGDQTDQHMFSRFTPEAIAMGAVEEYNNAKKRSRKYFELFEDGYLCNSNHDFRYVKKAAGVGIPDIFLKTFRELYGVPDSWKIADEFVIDGVLYKHGENCAGRDGALKTALDNCMSTCIGHFHGLGGCQYKANSKKLLFGMNVGCGVDRPAYAFAYGKNDKDKPILGCGIVYHDSKAEFIPMPAEYFRST